VTYRDIDLAMTSHDVTKQQQQQQQQRACVDWLLVQSVGFKDSAAMTCGQLLNADRQITSRGRRLLLHFHTSAHHHHQHHYQQQQQRRRLRGGPVRQQLKGFRVSVTGVDRLCR